jgi:hypothetical protein
VHLLETVAYILEPTWACSQGKPRPRHCGESRGAPNAFGSVLTWRFIASEERTGDPERQRWMAQWMELQQWAFPQRFFRENLKLGSPPGRGGARPSSAGA